MLVKISYVFCEIVPECLDNQLSNHSYLNITHICIDHIYSFNTCHTLLCGAQWLSCKSITNEINYILAFHGNLAKVITCSLLPASLHTNNGRMGRGRVHWHIGSQFEYVYTLYLLNILPCTKLIRFYKD